MCGVPRAGWDWSSPPSPLQATCRIGLIPIPAWPSTRSLGGVTMQRPRLPCRSCPARARWMNFQPSNRLPFPRDSRGRLWASGRRASTPGTSTMRIIGSSCACPPPSEPSCGQLRQYPGEPLKAIRAAVGEDSPMLFRFSAADFVPSGLERERALQEIHTWNTSHLRGAQA